jgi:hypothetical protein
MPFLGALLVMLMVAGGVALAAPANYYYCPESVFCK